MFSENKKINIESNFSHSSMSRNNILNIYLSEDNSEIKFEMKSFNIYNGEDVNSVIMKKDNKNEKFFDAILDYLSDN